MSDIRLRYSMIINYASILVRVVLLAISSIIIARKLDPMYYAIWGIVLSLANIYKAPTTLWKFWSIRFYRRGIKDSYESGLILTVIWMLACAFIHLIVSSAYSTVFHIDAFPLIYAGLAYIGLYTLFQYEFSTISIVYPEYIGYSNLLYSILRLLLVTLFVVLLDWEYYGVLIASTLNILIITMFVTKKLHQHHGRLRKGVNKKIVKKWLKMFPIPLISTANQYLNNLDRIAVSAVTLNELPVAYLTAAYSVTLPLKIDQNVLSGLYARLLRRKNRYDVEESLRIISFPLIFVLTTLAILGKPILSVMRPEYTTAYPVLLAMIFVILTNSYFQVFFNAIKAIDQVDLQEDISLATLAHSKLFQSMLVNVLKNIGSIVLALVFLFPVADNPVLSALVFPLGFLLTSPAALIWAYRETKKMLNIEIPLREISELAVSALPAILYFQLSGASQIVVNSFFRDAPILLLHITIGAAIYAAAAVTISSWTRKTIKAAFKALIAQPLRAS